MSDLFTVAGVEQSPVNEKLSVANQTDFCMALNRAITEDIRYIQQAQINKANGHFLPIAFKNLAIYYQCGYTQEQAVESYLEIVTNPGTLQYQIQQIMHDYQASL